RVPGSGCQAVRTATAPPPAGTFGPAVPLLGKEGITLPAQVLQNMKTRHGQLNTPHLGLSHQISARSHPVNTSESFAHPTRHQASGNWHPAKFPRVGCISVIP